MRRRTRSQEPGRARGSQEEPGTRRSQEEPEARSQEEPGGGPRGSQEYPNARHGAMKKLGLASPEATSIDETETERCLARDSWAAVVAQLQASV
jgi:hypothetical protein